jgi:hypothetical protein
MSPARPERDDRAQSTFLAAVLLNAQSTPRSPGPTVDMGQMTTNQSIQAFTSDDGVIFRAAIQGSMDGLHWFPFGSITSPGIRSEGQHTFQFIRANLEQVEGGSVTIMVSYNMAKQ